jgi:hypothetical protein
MFLGQKSSGSDVAAPILIHRFIHVLAGKTDQLEVSTWDLML